jgi:hypothetical protein
VQQGVFHTAPVAHPPYHGPVQVSRTHEPEGVPLAVVQAYGPGASLRTLMAKLTQCAAEVGADFVKVDRLVTRFDPVEESESADYECGTEKEPRTCTATSTTRKEVATHQVIGRAFRTTSR